MSVYSITNICGINTMSFSLRYCQLAAWIPFVLSNDSSFKLHFTYFELNNRLVLSLILAIKVRFEAMHINLYLIS